MRRAALIVTLAAGAAGAGTLVDYEVVNARAIPAPLTEWSGDPEEGAAAAARAGCFDCHNPKLNKGPRLDDVGERLSEGEIRLMIVEPRIRFPETTMPSYYAPGVYGEAPDELVGRTRLDAEEIEAIVAWLSRGGTEK